VVESRLVALDYGQVRRVGGEVAHEPVIAPLAKFLDDVLCNASLV
jgi:hypothetical protein